VTGDAGFRRRATGSRLVHRHADPLVHPTHHERLAALLRGKCKDEFAVQNASPRTGSSRWRRQFLPSWVRRRTPVKTTSGRGQRSTELQNAIAGILTPCASRAHAERTTPHRDSR